MRMNELEAFSKSSNVFTCHLVMCCHAYAYCLHTIFQKLHFSKSHFSKTSQEKYDHVIFLQPKSPKKCRKNFENRFTIKIIMPKKYFEQAFCMCKGGNPNTLKMKIKQTSGIILRVWHSAIHTLEFCFGLVHFK